MFGTKPRLKKLFEQRQTHWTTCTDRLMKELSTTVLPAIVKFIVNLRGEEAGARIRFTRVELAPHDDYPQGILVVWGNSVWEEGDIVTGEDGQQIPITEREAELLSAPLQVTLPLDLAETGKIPEIVSFLTATFEQAKARLAYLIEHQNAEVEHSTGDYMEERMYNMLNELDKEEVEPLDMDLSQFTPEERLLIELSHQKTGNIKQ